MGDGHPDLDRGAAGRMTGTYRSAALAASIPADVPNYGIDADRVLTRDSPVEALVRRVDGPVCRRRVRW